ncbi:hypothetical protein ACHAQH_005493 [Verticillium albo-atrum]
MPSKFTTQQPQLPEDAAATQKAEQSKDQDREQPWKVLIEAIEAENEKIPLGMDLYSCRDGLYAHSLAA